MEIFNTYSQTMIRDCFRFYIDMKKTSYQLIKLI